MRHEESNSDKLDQIQPTSFNIGDAEDNWQAHTRLLDISESGGTITIDSDVASGVGTMASYTSLGQPYQLQPIALSSAAITGNVVVALTHKNDGTNAETLTAWSQTLTNADDDTTIIFGTEQWFWDDLVITATTDNETASVFNFRVYIVARGG